MSTALIPALQFSESTYDWCVRVFSIVERALGLQLSLHHNDGQIEAGEIFLFNHFARFETFIPQYLIHRHTGAYCRSIAAAEFFKGDERFRDFLLNVGAVPNDMPGLLPALAAEILRGHKVIVFPEGGMVKDRRVLEAPGRYSIYSRTAKERRKQHTGAALLALAVDAFKQAILQAHGNHDARYLESWAERLAVEPEKLLAVAQRPTRIVPANITFYPIRVSDNLLRKGAELLTRRRELSRRLSEELLIEGNILLKPTDMDIRLGAAVEPRQYWSWLDRKLLPALTRRMDSIEEIFALKPRTGGWRNRLIAASFRRHTSCIRDDYMHRMYTGVSVHLSHLASSLAYQFLETGKTTEVAAEQFHKALYLAVKRTQRKAHIHLHTSLRNPRDYVEVLQGKGERFQQFLSTTGASGLIEQQAQNYRLLEKLCIGHDFDEIRTENLVAVYANEVEPLPHVSRAIRYAHSHVEKLSAQEFMRYRVDDLILQTVWDKQQWTDDKFAEINAKQTATAASVPYLFEGNLGHDVGVLLVHGFLASPAEMRPLAGKIAERGYTCLGVRLKGHGTSPWDLRECVWEDWLASVREGYEILRSQYQRIVIIGFSTGAALSLRLAAEQPEGLVGVGACSVPYKFQNKNMIFVPIMHGVNRLVRWLPAFEGVMPFRENQSEHPDVNYAHMPVRGLYELRQLVGTLDSVLPEVACPVSLLQSTEDPVVKPEGANTIHKMLGTSRKRLTMVNAKRHGIVYEDIGSTHQVLLDFIDECRDS